MIFLMPPHTLTNFEIEEYYQNEPKSDGVYSRDNPPRIKDVVYIINLDDYSDIGTYWIACMYKVMMLLILIVLE